MMMARQTFPACPNEKRTGYKETNTILYFRALYEYGRSSGLREVESGVVHNLAAEIPPSQNTGLYRNGEKLSFERNATCILALREAKKP